jgi:hypothetical protein
MSGFEGALEQARIDVARRSERDLAEHLRVHGVPERHDLGALLAVKEMFYGISGAAFDRVLRAARKAEN